MNLVKSLIPALALFACLDAGQASAADVGVMPMKAPHARHVVRVGENCSRVRSCHDGLCGWKRVCWSGCPDRYSCAPLYGAYGPYGGAGYWGAYSYGNLHAYRD